MNESEVIRMNHKIYETLDYHKIIRMMSEHAVTELGREHVLSLKPETTYERVAERLKETKEGLDILRIKGGLPLPKLADIRPALKRLEMDANLNGLEIAQIGKVLYTTSETVRFFEELKDNEHDFPAVFAWGDKLVVLPAVSGEIRQAVDEDGRVQDEASLALQQIRRQMRRSEMTIREELEKIVRGKQARYLSDTLITIRNDRYVIPAKSEYRSMFGGIVHDQSASGQTVYVEPKQVVELNNRLKQLQSEERQEIERILSELSAAIAPHVPEIRHNAYVLSQLDVINTKALFGKQIGGVIPSLSEENHVSLRQARHPLLDRELAVANDLTIGKDYQAIVITGPNTGGKTITLKTLGLLQLMGQAGIPVTVAEDSVLGVFGNIFADIGDEQSIEQNLSTFSSHMTNIVSILEEVDDTSLVLFDELGAGTDPQEGAALAIAILDEVGSRNAYVMATTHYPELKVYGYNRPFTTNASMEFDVNTLSPTYRLLIGVPGRSNAFEISQRLGLSTTIITQAKQLIDGESHDLNDMISDLESSKKQAEEEASHLHLAVEESETLLAELKNAVGYLKQEREKELEKAKEAANELIEEARREAETIVSDIREKQKRVGEMQVKEHEFIEMHAQLDDLRHEQKQLKKNKVLQKAKKEQQLKIGDDVKVESFGQRGTIIGKQKEGLWEVQMGIIKMALPESDLTKLAPEKETRSTIVTIKDSDGKVGRRKVESQLDLRGKRYDDAMHELENYLDEAILSGYSQIIIVHGKGTGALRTGVNEFLRSYRGIKSFGLAPQNQGGSGATVVEFK